MTHSVDQIAQTLPAQFGPDDTPTLHKGFCLVPYLFGTHRCQRFCRSPKHLARSQHFILPWSNQGIGQTASDLYSSDVITGRRDGFQTRPYTKGLSVYQVRRL